MLCSKVILARINRRFEIANVWVCRVRHDLKWEQNVEKSLGNQNTASVSCGGDFLMFDVHIVWITGGKWAGNRKKPLKGWLVCLEIYLKYPNEILFRNGGQFYSILGKKLRVGKLQVPTAVGRKVAEKRKKENETICMSREERVRGQIYQKSEKTQSVQESKQDSRGGKRNQKMKKRKLFVAK